MPYEFLEDASIADIAFIARGRTLDELFAAAAEATFASMADLSTIPATVKKIVTIRGTDPDHLLYDFLSELIFLKDTEGLLFREFAVQVTPTGVTATVRGGKIDPKTQKLRNDVKAITMHQFGISKTKDGYEAQVTVDI
ncbi:MAG: archease [Nanoarchaeota archaeon]|nr:archease [Nanoarchaeota archaeon]